MGLLVVASCVVAGVAWRLAQGPIELGGLADQLRAQLVDNTGPVRVSFEGLALEWEGFQKGVDYPIDLRISNVSVADPAGRRLVTAPDAHVTFSLAGLLLGRLVPRAIEVDHARIAVTRDVAGTVSLGSNLESDEQPDTAAFDLRQLRDQLSRPAGTDHDRSWGLLDQIRRARFVGAAVTLQDRASGLSMQSSDMAVEFVRGTNAHIHGSLQAPIQVSAHHGSDGQNVEEKTAGQHTFLKAAVELTPGAGGSLDASLTSFRPAAIGTFPPALAALAAADLPVALSVRVAFDAAFKLGRMQAGAQLGEGVLRIAGGAIPLRNGIIGLAGTLDRIAITEGHFDVAHSPESSPEIIEVAGSVTHVADRINAAVTLGLDQFDIADLRQLWPPAIGGGARPWITEHVMSGRVTHATAAFVVESDDALHDVVLTKASGDLDGSNGTFTWMDDMPPVEQTEFHLGLIDADTLDINVPSAHQRIRSGGADLLVRNGQMRITGLSLRDQAATISLQVDGPVTSALALLKEPRLHLLSDHPIALKIGGGEASAMLDFQFPLDNKVQIDDVQIHGNAHLKDLRLPQVAAGRDLDDGVFDLAISKDGLSLKGRGSLVAIPIAVDGTMDFLPGPPDQIVQKIGVTGRPDAGQLDAAGLHVTDFVTGPIQISAIMLERRNGEGSIAIGSDLAQAALVIAPLAWTKPAGISATASATLLMSHDRLTKIDRIAMTGDRLLVKGTANFANERIRSIQLDTIQLDRTQGHGTIHVATDGAIDVVLQGPQIDLLPKLTEKSAGGDDAGATTPKWTSTARFDRAILANGEGATNVLAKAAGAGDTVLSLDAVGAIQEGAPQAGVSQGSAGFSIKIMPVAGKRRLLVDAKDAGRFLDGMDMLRMMQGGHLTIDAMFEQPTGYRPLTGNMTIGDVVVKNSPVLGKLLQAVTLYGLVDALRGPGMSFSRVVVPFRYDGAGLNLDNAHAANPSLGLTAKGRIGLSAGQTAISGTIVPAYFFNSMLGQLPLVGKLFSPETGGGVFAARFGISGLIENPTITINPISALTPGFLRDIFGIFDNVETAAPEPPTQSK